MGTERDGRGGGSLVAAVLREGREETGLQKLRTLNGAPDQWLHLEWHPPDGSAAPIEFEFF